MTCEIVIRKARPDDEAARVELVRTTYAGYQRDAFFLFFFQELTLQVGVLVGAVLFIFAGVSLHALLLLPPALAAAVALAVHVAHVALADKRVQEMRKEIVGFVAELHGPLFTDPLKHKPTIVPEEEWRPTNNGPVHTQVVGTLSISEFWGPDTAGWLHALAVHPQWRGLGVCSRLLRSARAWGAGSGTLALHALVSELQGAAARALAAAGWAPRAAQHRRLCGAQLTLALSHLVLDLAAPV